MSKFAANVPSKEELRTAIDAALKDNKDANAKTLKAILKKENPDWSIPERRVKKFLKAQTVSESATIATTRSKRFLLGKTASNLFGRKADDAETAPMEDSPPAVVEIVSEQAVETLGMEAPAEEPVVQEEVQESAPESAKEEIPEAVQEEVQEAVKEEKPVVEENTEVAVSEVASDEAVAIAETPDADDVYKDDNDGKKNECAVFRSCVVM